MKIIGLPNPSIQHCYLFVNSTGSKSFTVHDATVILSLLTSTRARCIEAMSFDVHVIDCVKLLDGILRMMDDTHKAQHMRQWQP